MAETRVIIMGKRFSKVPWSSGGTRIIFAADGERLSVRSDCDEPKPGEMLILKKHSNWRKWKIMNKEGIKKDGVETEAGNAG